MKNKYAFGWKPQLPDHRDTLFAYAPVPTGKPLPPMIDNEASGLLSPMLNQGYHGTCTANMGMSAVWHTLAIQGKPIESNAFAFLGSRRFTYYNTCLREGSDPLQDPGATIRGTFKSIAKDGVVREEAWPYNDNIGEAPPPLIYDEGKLHQGLVYRTVRQTEHDMKSCLAEGFGICLGFSVYASFESEEVAKTGIADTPQIGERLLGGHAVYVVGYNDTTRRFKVQNSWGDAWGDRGFFYVPYRYFLSPNLAADLWTLRKMEV
jgi:C1A family cysteine protease